MKANRMNKPTRLLDGMPYVDSANTDIRKTFARVRKQLAEQRQKHEHTKQVVRQIKVGEAK
jgi:hypothetical protein